MFKSMFDHFFNVTHENKLRNHCYVNTLPRVFYTKDVMKVSQGS